MRVLQQRRRLIGCVEIICFIYVIYSLQKNVTKNGTVKSTAAP